MAVSVETNGHTTNGAQIKVKKTNGVVAAKPDVAAQNGSAGEGATQAFSRFIINTSHKDIPEAVSTKLKDLLLDYFGVCCAAGHAGESTPSILAGVSAFAGQATGSCTVFANGSSFPPQYAALLNGALAHTYDFDDTHGPAILHPGASIISAALAEAESRGSNGADLVLALAVGYEVAIRLGIACGIGAYKQGFHSTATCGIFGSVAAVCKLRNCSQRVVENALGLAISKAAGSMQFLENGSWNKRLHPGFAAHDALLCVCLAEVGVLGAAKPIEGKYGLLHNFTCTPKPELLLPELGTKWQVLGTACKPFPACRMIHGPLEMVGKCRKQHANKGVPDRITITIPAPNYQIVGLATPNKIKPETIVDAQFSTYFQTAAAWIYGNTLGWAIYEKIGDAKVTTLSRKITVEKDESYINLESRMRAEWADGTVCEEEVIYPLAEPQKPFEWNTGVQKKFLGLAEPVYGVDGAKEICMLVQDVENVKVKDMMKSLA